MGLIFIKSQQNVFSLRTTEVTSKSTKPKRLHFLYKTLQLTYMQMLLTVSRQEQNVYLDSMNPIQLSSI